MGIVLFISFSRCGGGGDAPEPTSQTNTPTTNSNTPIPVVKSNEASISKISFMVNGKNYEATIAEMEITVNLPHGTTIPSKVTITTLEHSPKAVSSVSQGSVLTVNDEKAIITITAEDETTTKTYTINFVREVRVTFNVNDNITVIPSLDLKKGSKASIPATDPMPATGKSFGYWTAVMDPTPANYGKDLFDFDTTPINEDITLYAVWQEKPVNKVALITLIDAAINDQGDSPNLNFIDTSLITDMKELFKEKLSFNGDISGWDTSEVTNMEAMFDNAQVFNGDISGWNTSNVSNMESMFDNAEVFNQDIGDWDTGKVTTMKNMFFNAFIFNQNIGDWNTGKVSNMEAMFKSALAFNQDIGDWDTSQVTNMKTMFNEAENFNQDIGDWNTGNVITMEAMFYAANRFNQDISGWNVDEVTDHAAIFDFCPIDDDHKPTFRTNDGN